ncbi:MAG TPA: hypothetical protein VIM81_06775 [Gammaproteobacteria bacterium]
MRRAPWDPASPLGDLILVIEDEPAVAEATGMLRLRIYMYPPARTTPNTDAPAAPPSRGGHW